MLAYESRNVVVNVCVRRHIALGHLMSSITTNQHGPRAPDVAVVHARKVEVHRVKTWQLLFELLDVHDAFENDAERRQWLAALEKGYPHVACALNRLLDVRRREVVATFLEFKGSLYP
jgi:hypothetical protein